MKKLFLISAFLALVVMTSGCPKGTQGLATASDTIAHALDNAQQAVQLGLSSGVVTPAEDAAFEAALVKAATAGKVLDDSIRGQENASSVSAKATAFIAAFDALNKSGLAIKNPNVQLGVSTALNGAEAALAIIEAEVK